MRLFINALFVVQTHRHHGIGTALLRDALGGVSPEDTSVHVYASIRDWYAARGFTVLEVEPDTGNALLRSDRPFFAA